MSGRKCSNVYLEERARLLLQVKNEKDSALNISRTLTQRVNNICSKITTISIEDQNISQRFKDYIERLNRELNDIKSREEMLNNIKLPDTVMNISTDKLRAIHKNILQIKEENNKTNQLCDDVDIHIINLKTADETLASIEIGLQKFEDEFRLQELLLKRWVMEEYDDLSQKHKTITLSLIQYKDALQRGEEPAKVAASFKEIKDRIDGLVQRLTELVREANQREESHRRRLYILKALRDVCNSLGFEEVEEPRYEKEGDSNSPITQRFDTLTEGFITFRIYLDNKIESDSDIALETCGEEFDKLSKLLIEEYGIKTEFRLTEQEELPKKLTKTEKPIPHQQPQVRRHGM